MIAKQHATQFQFPKTDMRLGYFDQLLFRQKIKACYRI